MVHAARESLPSLPKAGLGVVSPNPGRVCALGGARGRGAPSTCGGVEGRCTDNFLEGLTAVHPVLERSTPGAPCLWRGKSR